MATIKSSFETQCEDAEKERLQIMRENPWIQELFNSVGQTKVRIRSQLGFTPPHGNASDDDAPPPRDSSTGSRTDGSEDDQRLKMICDDGRVLISDTYTYTYTYTQT